MMTTLITFLAVNGGTALNLDARTSCVQNPAQPSCAKYHYPNASTDLQAICGMGAMSAMSGCSVHKRCSLGGADGAVCGDFSLLLRVCDQMVMTPCTNAMSLCGKGSAVEACHAVPQALTRMPTEQQANAAALKACAQMPSMSACSACTGATAAQCPDPLLSLSKLCQAMPAMDECMGWGAWCALPKSAEELPAYCAGAPPPGGGGVPMRMYFHLDWRDYILFQSWVPDSARSYFVSIVAVMAGGVTSAWLRGVRAVLERHLARAAGKVGRNWTLRDNACRAAVVALSTTLDYALMLVAMTYNVGLFFAVIVGLALGTLGFGHWGRAPAHRLHDAQAPFLAEPERDDDSVACH